MKPHIPDTLPLAKLDWVDLVPRIGASNAALARFDGSLQGVVNPALLLAPLATREAVLSSRIEGTIANIEEVYAYEVAPSEKDAARSADIREILNYRRALHAAQAELEKRPISLNMIKRIHATLLEGVRGHDRARGEFRTVQNYIGRRGARIEEASYVPPEPAYLMEHLSNLEKYVHAEEKDRLVQLAVVHAQFEIIHPFLDGNGRVGRILIPLFLYEKGMLSSPVFYLSSYLEAHRDEYIDRLRAITADGNWLGWIRFFLDAVVEQAAENAAKVREILNLYDRMKRDIPEIARSQYAVRAIDALFSRPIFTRPEFATSTGIPRRTAERILRELENAGILRIAQQGGGRQPEVVSFPALLDIIEGRTTASHG